MFFKEEWRQRARPPDAGPDFVPEQGVTHGWGGFVNVGRIEVYGRPVKR